MGSDRGGGCFLFLAGFGLYALFLVVLTDAVERNSLRSQWREMRKEMGWMLMSDISNYSQHSLRIALILNGIHESKTHFSCFFILCFSGEWNYLFMLKLKYVELFCKTDFSHRVAKISKPPYTIGVGLSKLGVNVPVPGCFQVYVPCSWLFCGPVPFT